LLGVVIGQKAFILGIDKIKNYLQLEGHPKEPEGQLQNLLSNLTKQASNGRGESYAPNIENNLILTTLKDGKVYLGVIEKADFNLNHHPDESYMAITVIYSGYRAEVTKEVKYTRDYLAAVKKRLIKIEETLVDGNKDIEIAKFNFNMKNKLTYIPIHHIATITIFSPELGSF
jgi:hypothetical protein